MMKKPGGTQRVRRTSAPKPGNTPGAPALAEPAAPHGSPAHVAQISQQLRNVGVPNPSVRY